MEIVYLSLAINIPIGGIKVINRHSEMLNQARLLTTVFDPESSKFVCDWFTIKPGFDQVKPYGFVKNMKCARQHHFDLRPIFW